MVATELHKLAMETDEERKARMKKMVATTQLRLALETEDERRARLIYLSDHPIYIHNKLYLILIDLRVSRSLHSLANKLEVSFRRLIQTYETVLLISTLR